MRTIVIFLMAALLMSNTLYAQTEVEEPNVKKDSTKKEIIIRDAWSKEKKSPKKKKTTSFERSNRYNHETNIGVGKTKLVIKEGQDTTIIGLGNHELIITESNNRSNVRWENKRRRNRHSYFAGHWTGFEIGVATFKEKSSDFMELTYPKTSAVNINVLQYNIPLIGHRFGLVTGLGLSWYNFRFKEDITMIETVGIDASNPLTFKKKYTTQIDIESAYKTDERVKKSKLTMSYITVPLLLELQSSNRRSYIAAGVIGGLKLGAHTKIKFNDGDKEKDFDDFYLSPFKADATVRFGVGIFRLWATYSLIPLFEDDKLYDNANNEYTNKTPIAFGISIGFD